MGAKSDEPHSKERRRQYLQSRGAKQLSMDQNSRVTSLDDTDVDDIKTYSYELHHDTEKVFEGQTRRHTCTEAMYRDKTNFDYKNGPKIHKQYSLQ